MKVRKPRPIELYHCGAMVKIKCDRKLTNIWINNSPVSLKDAQRLSLWLNRYIAASGSREGTDNG